MLYLFTVLTAYSTLILFVHSVSTTHRPGHGISVQWEVLTPLLLTHQCSWKESNIAALTGHYSHTNIHAFPPCNLGHEGKIIYTEEVLDLHANDNVTLVLLLLARFPPIRPNAVEKRRIIYYSVPSLLVDNWGQKRRRGWWGGAFALLITTQIHSHTYTHTAMTFTNIVWSRPHKQESPLLSLPLSFNTHTHTHTHTHAHTHTHTHTHTHAHTRTHTLSGASRVKERINYDPTKEKELVSWWLHVKKTVGQESVSVCVCACARVPVCVLTFKCLCMWKSSPFPGFRLHHFQFKDLAPIK